MFRGGRRKERGRSVEWRVRKGIVRRDVRNNDECGQGDRL